MIPAAQPTTSERLLALFAQHFRVQLDHVPAPLFLKVLEAFRPDSLDAVELVMELEDEFSIVITDDEVMDLGEDVRLSDILALVERKRGVAS